MSKKLKRSAVALVLAATMVFSSQGVLTAFAVGENETSTAVDVSALEPILDKEETVVVEESGNTDETETPEVEVCEECQGENGNHAETCPHYVDPTTPPNGSTDDETNNGQEQQECTCGAEEGQPHEEGCPLYEEPEAPVCTCGAEEGQPHKEGCPLYEEPTSPECTCGAEEGQPHEEGCPLYEENTEDTEDTQEPSEEDVAAAKNVSDLIGALPEASTLDPETTDVEALTAQVKAAREAYDKLTDAQKALVEKAVLDKLVALEGALEGLEQVETIPELNEDTVAVIDDQQFNTISAAVKAAETGDTIYILKDFTLDSGITYKDKEITIAAADNSTFTIEDNSRCGISISGDSKLTFKNLTFTTNGQIYLYNNANLTFQNSTLNMDGKMHQFSSEYYCSAISIESKNASLTIDNTHVTICNYPLKGSAIRWDDSSSLENEYVIKIINNSDFESFNCYAGFTGTCNITIDHSKVNVHNHRGNGGNGSHFVIQNESTVYFNDNTTHGLSAGTLTINNSKVTCNNNGANGIHTNNDMRILNHSDVTIKGNQCGTSSAWTIPAALHVADQSGISCIDSTSTVTIQENLGSGILLKSGKLTVEDGAKITVTNNKAEMLGYGGGINNRGIIVLPENAVIYNNHADKAGDDIYIDTNVNPSAQITFGKVGSDWVLDDTNLPITNWFYDGKKDGEDTNRWSVGNYYEVFTPGAITGLQAIKAAHQYSYNPDTPTIPDGDFEWETSKSKHAEELEKQADGTYTSNVTLSLPAADFEPEIDVVFVIDDTHAGSGIFSGSVQKLLDELCAKNNLDVNVGIVTFDAVARDWLDVTSNGSISGLVPLDENYDAIIGAVNTQLSYSSTGEEMKIGGTNTEAAVEKANEMLSSGTGSEQHVVMFSDMYGYVYYGDLTVGGETYHNVPLSKRHQNYELGQLCIAPPMYDTWAEVYAGQGQDNATYDTFFRDSSWDKYWSIYTSASPSIYDAPKGGTEYGVKYFTPFEKSSCMTYDAIMQLMNSGVKVTIVNNDFNPGENGATIQAIKDGMLADLASKGATVIQKDTANGEPLDATQMEEVFTALENKLLYVVDAGSQVIDVIGEGTDNMGNAYDFDFVDVVSLTVGGEPLEIHHEDNSNVYYFGSADNNGIYPFVLTYYPDGLGVATMSAENVIAGELFVWDINVPITVDETVQLTYTVKLTNPQTAAGTYGQYDANGKNGSTSLYTNKEATLYPVDSNGDRGVPENFLKPTVSYTVGGNDNPGTDPTPDPDPDPDRPSRPNRDDDDDWEPLPDAPVKDKPTTEVDVPEETETPTTEQPDKYNPETGDTTTVFAAMALAAVSLGGVVLLGRKKK